MTPISASRKCKLVAKCCSSHLISQWECSHHLVHNWSAFLANFLWFRHWELNYKKTWTSLLMDVQGGIDAIQTDFWVHKSNSKFDLLYIYILFPDVYAKSKSLWLSILSLISHLSSDHNVDFWIKTWSSLFIFIFQSRHNVEFIILPCLNIPGLFHARWVCESIHC